VDIHLDLIGGLAGDMFVAGMVDLFPHLEKGLEDNLRRCGALLEGVSCRFEQVDDGTLVGRRFRVDRRVDPQDDHGHAHVDWRLIRGELQSSDLSPAVKQRAIAIFSLLAKAESRVHGRPEDEIAFHEVGAWDSIADIVSAAFVIEAAGAATWTVGAIPLGSGRVKTAHGALPVPAPATAILLEGFSVIDDGVPGERVTPTGAAILRNLARPEPSRAAPRRLGGSGFGFGTRKLPNLSNFVRFLSFETVEAQALSNEVLVVEFEVDDQTPEDLALALDRLRAQRGVHDVVQIAVYGKKNRLACSIRLLGDAAALDAIAALCFEETSTIGLRYRIEQRLILPRETRRATVGERNIRVKSVQRPSGVSAKAEAMDLADAPNRLARDKLRRAAEEEP
jgi:pyridinium-3,5-bisthiocarboxylic acid mononucleotide nickel chelatase